MAFPLPIPAELRAAAPAGVGVLLAASGGVDSTLAMMMLRELGCDVHAVTFKNFCYADAGLVEDGGRSCCSVEAIEEARRLATSCGVEHRVTNVEEIFGRNVIEPFVRSYAAGLTPNPCVDCNASVRFPHLLRLADLMGCELVATGHYARVDHGGRRPRLLRGVDREKDQSYFLHGIGREALARSVFPLGWYVKQQVRQAAAALDLPVAEKPESQEICFVPDDDRSFLFADADVEPGDFVDAAGNVMGRHHGLPFYTIGQRRGLGIAAPRSLYVTAIDVPANRIRVGFAEELDVTRIEVDRFAPLVDDLPAAGYSDREIVARIRHRHRGAVVKAWRLRDGCLSVDLAGPERGVSPGQALVLYDGEAVLGGGRIVSTGCADNREESPCPVS